MGGLEINMETEKVIPNDWSYVVSEVLNRRIYSNQLYVSDMIDLIHDNTTNEFGQDSIEFFQFNDQERTIKLSIKTKLDFQAAMNSMKSVHNNSIYEFCKQYSGHIGNALLHDCKSPLYAYYFCEAVIYSNIYLLSTLCMIFGHPTVSRTDGEYIYNIVFRLY